MDRDSCYQCPKRDYPTCNKTCPVALKRKEKYRRRTEAWKKKQVMDDYFLRKR